MKIVITDAQTVFDELVTTAPLRALGEVTEYGLLRYDEVAEKIADADAVICNKTVLDAHSLRLAKKLRYIGNAGSYSTNAVAQHTFALMLEAYNNTSRYNRYVHDGLWKCSATFSPFVYPLNELADKTLGIVGLGAIGQAVAKIANAFQMKVIGCNRSRREAEGVETVSFDELLRRSDIVTVHCPLNADSRDMFNRDAFAKMKKDALFINTARGGVVVEQDLYDALESGQIGMAAVDTIRVEPMEEDCILMNAQNCIMTPHIAWAPVETRERLIGIVADNIANFLAGHPTNRVDIN